VDVGDDAGCTSPKPYPSLKSGWSWRGKPTNEPAAAYSGVWLSRNVFLQPRSKPAAETLHLWPRRLILHAFFLFREKKKWGDGIS
jgi:hypothetical protein